MLALCQHNTLAHYAFYYAGIFDVGLVATWCEKWEYVVTSLDILKFPQDVLICYDLVNHPSSG